MNAINMALPNDWLSHGNASNNPERMENNQCLYFTRKEGIKKTIRIYLPHNISIQNYNLLAEKKLSIDIIDLFMVSKNILYP